MGYKRKRQVYKLDFTGTDYEGLEVQVSGLTTGEYLDLATQAAAGEEKEGTERMLKMLAEHLVAWNLEDDEGPIPLTFDGIKTNDITLNLMIINAWTSALGDVPDPLQKNSPSGEPSLVASIPMETSSAALMP